MSVVLILTTALPWLASMLLTDIFAGLSVLSLFILVAARRQDFHGRKMPAVRLYRVCRRPPTAQRWRCCSGCVASAGSRGPCWASGSPFPDCVQGSLTIVAGAAMLLSANFALSGQLAWTPGGYGVAFGRMMQDGIVARYLRRSLSGAAS